MKLETVALGSISPDPANTRKHSRRNLDAIKASLRRFGQQKPIVVDAKGVVLAGNGTLAAATELGWSEIQIVRTALAGVDATAFGIADNRTAELAEWEDNLGNVLASLAADDFPLEEIGFDDEDLADLLGEPSPSDADAEPQIDKAEELRAKWGVELGQVWELGEHRIACGDSTKQATAEMLMRGDVADMVLTDPPYGVSYVGKTIDALTIENDDLDETELTALVTASFDVAQAISRGGAYWYATVPPGPLHLIFAEDWKRRGILRQIMVWAKDAMVLGHSEYHYQHEPILFGWTKGERHKNSDRTRTTLWHCPRPKQNREHPTMKPVELWERAIRDGSRAGEIVYEPFSGSGTTILACERTGRKCRAIELNPGYVAVAIQRWADATGKEPRKL